MNQESAPCRVCGQPFPFEQLTSPRKIGGIPTWKCHACFKAFNVSKLLEPQTRKHKRPADIAWRYGLEQDEIEALRVAQHDVCAICKSPPPRGHPLYIDHNHSTGKVRALLCSRCNVLVGYVEKTPDLVVLIEAYLERHT